MPVIINGSTGISGTDGSAGTPAVQGTDTNTGMFFPAADQIAFAEGGVEAMRLDASGNVGIGVAAPARRLDIQQSGTNYQLRIGDAGGVNFYDIGRDTSNGLLTFYGSQAVASGYVFSTVNGERARINSSGNFLVGRTNTSFGSSTGVWIDPAGTGVFERDSESCLFLARVGGNSNGSVANFYWGSGRTFVGNISVQSTSTSYNTSSDYRLKENVVPLTAAAARVQALKPSRFNFIADPSRTVDGFIAHEAAEVVPEAVSGEKDAVNEDGSIKPQGIDQSKLVPLLTAALQEALTEIAALKARVAVLEAN